MAASPQQSSLSGLARALVQAGRIKEGEGESGLGNWDPNADMITGERRAVALCWMDGSADVGGNTAIQEMNVIMFQYLNE